ncbi:hypothetical protein ACQ4M4_25750 [Leptolyngbya sp. AN02str]
MELETVSFQIAVDNAIARKRSIIEASELYWRSGDRRRTFQYADMPEAFRPLMVEATTSGKVSIQPLTLKQIEKEQQSLAKISRQRSWRN